ncbi:MAG: hypothetical protein P1U78_03050 [Alcanivoracaceae bacterium]|nr:hypothetical protein [Alcanivoracaceae bacterium]
MTKTALLGSRPLLRIMKNAPDFNAVFTEKFSVDHDKRDAINHQFPGVSQSSNASGAGMIGQDQRSAIDDSHHNIDGNGGVVLLGDVGANCIQVVACEVSSPELLAWPATWPELLRGRSGALHPLPLCLFLLHG